MSRDEHPDSGLPMTCLYCAGRLVATSDETDAFTCDSCGAVVPRDALHSLRAARSSMIRPTLDELVHDPENMTVVCLAEYALILEARIAQMIGKVQRAGAMVEQVTARADDVQSGWERMDLALTAIRDENERLKGSATRWASAERELMALGYRWIDGPDGAECWAQGPAQRMEIGDAT